MWHSQKFTNCLAAALALVFILPASTHAAQRELQLDVSRGQLVTLAQPATSVFVADPAIAGVQVPSDRQVFVFGKKPGQTTLFVLGDDGKQIVSMLISVKSSVADAQSAVDNAAPGAIHIRGANNGLELQGNVATPETGSAVSRAATTSIGKDQPVQNSAKVLTSAQVTLRVRIAEVDRNIIKALGFNWNEATKIGQFSLGAVIGRQTFTPTTPAQFIPNATGGSTFLSGSAGGFSTQTVIDALASEGLVTMLAEPTLTALSGEPASFLAGGEFPIPIVQPGTGGAATIGIDFKQFGVSLSFVPTVVNANRISLHVKPEVSQLVTSTGAGAVQIDGFTIPGLTVRRAETTIELGSGESFAIAGLIQNNTNANVSNYPGLADLPVLGPLFRSTSFSRNESELVVIVTPYITEPIADPRDIRLPTDGLAPPNDIDLILRGRVNARNPTAADGVVATTANTGALHITGDAGFDIE
ncbi:MAG: type II and III secretion system protein family protein [Aliidongia sp.]